jgi:tetratricopeptide (TPR) repeat protein
MFGCQFRTSISLLAFVISTVLGHADINPLVQERWSETRTAHFNIYSCGATQEVFKLAARLEQFREAYAQLAGAQAVSSPPIIVMAYPDLSAMQPFLPLYQGKPVSLAGFFKRSSDENLIVLTLSGTNSGSMQTIFHEYTHLLLRQNDRIWPLWLQEGMAEIYSTFDAAGHQVCFGLPIEHHLRFLTENSLLPLKELFAVTPDSAQYNESEHQGIFYAESWLLTHYLMLGDSPLHKTRFKQLTALLRQGQKPDQAFTNAFGTTLTAMEDELRQYLARGQFESIRCVVKADLSSPRSVITRPIAPAETCFRLGNQLLRINRLESAENYFMQSKKFAPASPLPFEGLGLLATERQKPDVAVHWLRESLNHGSTSFLAHYTYARESYQLTADAGEHYTRLEKNAAAEIRAELHKAITLMPDFGPAHELLGFFETVQGEDPALAEQQLQRAIQLEPGNQWYLLSLAQAQLVENKPDAARQTLQPLRLPNVEATLRTQAETVFQQIDRQSAHQSIQHGVNIHFP